MPEPAGRRGRCWWCDRTVAALQHAPAAMSLARLLAIPAIVRMAWRGERIRCCAALAGSVLVDLADGIVARRVPNAAALRRQRALDGVADAVFFVAAPLCAVRLRPSLPSEERAGLAVLALCQGASTLACLARFGRLPRYHSVSYKWCAGALGLALVGRVAGGRWRIAFRPALGGLSLAHLEATAITLLLDRYRTPVRSVLAAARPAPHPGRPLVGGLSTAHGSGVDRRDDALWPGKVPPLTPRPPLPALGEGVGG